jgi:hypothetical protein
MLIGKIKYFYSRPESVHVGVDDHQHKRNNKVEDQPDVDHLDVGGGRQTFIHLEYEKLEE